MIIATYHRNKANSTGRFISQGKFMTLETDAINDAKKEYVKTFFDKLHQDLLLAGANVERQEQAKEEFSQKMAALNKVHSVALKLVSH